MNQMRPALRKATIYIRSNYLLCDRARLEFTDSLEAYFFFFLYSFETIQQTCVWINRTYVKTGSLSENIMGICYMSTEEMTPSRST